MQTNTATTKEVRAIRWTPFLLLIAPLLAAMSPAASAAAITRTYDFVYETNEWPNETGLMPSLITTNPDPIEWGKDYTKTFIYPDPPRNEHQSQGDSVTLTYDDETQSVAFKYNSITWGYPFGWKTVMYYEFTEAAQDHWLLIRADRTFKDLPVKYETYGYPYVVPDPSAALLVVPAVALAGLRRRVRRG